MIILLDTSTPVCRFGVVGSDATQWYEWQADRELAKGLLKYIIVTLQKNQRTLTDITGIGVFEGPGSFTGLRIGLTVMNTLADSQSIAIVGGRGDQWADDVVSQLQSGHNDRIVMPYYGSEAHITKPRK